MTSKVLSDNKSISTVNNVLPIFRPSRDVLLLVLNHLNASDLGNLSATCHHLRGRIQIEETLWMKIANRELDIQNVFAKWSWRDCVIIRKQWEKNVFLQRNFFEGNELLGSFLGSFRKHPFGTLFTWNSQITIKADIAAGNFSAVRNSVKGYICQFYDGERSVYIKSIETEIDPTTGEERDLVNSAGRKSAHIELLIFNNSNQKIGNFEILYGPIICLNNGFSLIGNKIIFHGKSPFILPRISFHDIPTSSSKISFENFTHLQGNLIEITETHLIFSQPTHTVRYDFHQNIVTESIPTPIDNVRFQTIVADNILVQVTTNELIGYQKAEVEQEDGSKRLQWQEIWRGHNPTANEIIAARDKSPYFFVDTSQINNIYQLYDARTGKSIRKMKLDCKKDSLTDPSTNLMYNSFTYLNKARETILRDFSPRKLLKIRDPNAGSFEIFKDKIKFKMKSYSLAKRISFCFIAFLAIAAFFKYIYLPRSPLKKK
ncbi:MAG: hypothetical protein H0W88_09160 [Parachlamydiaceae bacterium]|nr:hypothetical protein [Parachlamydiaceae bacterium]